MFFLIADFAGARAAIEVPERCKNIPELGQPNQPQFRDQVSMNLLILKMCKLVEVNSPIISFFSLDIAFNGTFDKVDLPLLEIQQWITHVKQFGYGKRPLTFEQRQESSGFLLGH